MEKAIGESTGDGRKLWRKSGESFGVTGESFGGGSSKNLGDLLYYTALGNSIGYENVAHAGTLWLIPLIRWVGIGTHPALIFWGSDSEKLDYD